MRKGISILFALVIFLSGAHITIATHYCGGKVFATKVSLSGELASCGMEGTERSCPLHGNQLTTHCCDNQIVIAGINNNFTSPVSFLQDNDQNILQVYYIPVNQSFHSLLSTITSYTSFNPPGSFLTSTVNLEDICVHRI